jgi:hypothetical protein
MNSFTTRIAKAAVTGIVLSSVLITTACGSGNQPAATPQSPAQSQSADATPSAMATPTPAPINNSLTQAQKDAALKQFADKPLGIDPASVSFPADVTAAFGDKASANLVHDTLLFEQKADGFHQLQVLPRTVDMNSMAGIVNAELSPMMTPEVLGETVKQFSSPNGTAVIPMFTAEDFNGMSVNGKTYHPVSDGFMFNYGKPVVTMGTATVDVVQNGQTIKVKTANVSMQADILIGAKEGVVKVNQVRSLNLIAGPDGHWLVAAFNYPTTITATDK